MNTLLVTTKTSLGYQWENDEYLGRFISDVNNRQGIFSALSIQSSNDGLVLTAKSQRPEDVFDLVKKIIDLVPAQPK
jgi:hypothetical protein